MLETIKQYIANVPNKSFNVFFQEYVIHVQDRDIKNEVDLFMLFNNPDIRKLNKQINSYHKEFERNG